MKEIIKIYRPQLVNFKRQRTIYHRNSTFSTLGYSKCSYSNETLAFHLQYWISSSFKETTFTFNNSKHFFALLGFASNFGRKHISATQLCRHGIAKSSWRLICSSVALSCIGEQGWRSVENTRLPPMWPGFDSKTRCHMRVEFVRSLLCSERFFRGHFGFPLPSKTYIW